MDGKLSTRERQVAELVAWGASAKEVPELLQSLYGGKEISYFTVTNTLRNIYIKTSCNKANELSAWWFCHELGVDSSLSPITKAGEMKTPRKGQFARTVYSILFLIILIPQIMNLDEGLRPQRVRTQRTEQVRGSRARKKE